MPITQNTDNIIKTKKYHLSTLLEKQWWLVRLPTLGLANLLWRFRIKGLENIPDQGPAILICNHVTDFDSAVLLGACQRPATLLVYYPHFSRPLVGRLLHLVGAIPIAMKQQNREYYDAVWEKIQTALQAGKLIIMFPEGRLTRDGSLQQFKPGLLKILAQAQARGLQPPVIPLGFRGLWGSTASWAAEKGPFSKLGRRGWRNPVRLKIGPPIETSKVDLVQLHQVIQNLIDAPD